MGSFSDPGGRQGPRTPGERPALTTSRHPLALELLLGWLTAFAPLSIDMYLPALPAIGQDLQASPSQVGLTLVSFFVGISLGMLLAGPLLDRYGRTRPLYVGLGLFVLSSAGCALAHRVELLVAMRFLQALGGSVGLVVTRAVVRDLHTGLEAARMLSRLVLIMGAAPILAPLVGGFLLDHFGWRSIFGLLALTGAAAWVAVLSMLPETAPEPRHRPLASELAALARDRSFAVHTLAMSVTQAGMFAYISGAPFVLLGLYQVPPERFGWFFGANALGYIVASQLNRRLAGRFGLAGMLRSGLLACSLAGVGVAAVALTGAGGLWGVSGSLFVYLASLGFVGPNATTLAMEAQGDRAGLASAAMGALGFGLAACTSGVVSAAQDGTAIPMALTMAACAFLSLGLVTLGGRDARPAG